MTLEQHQYIFSKIVKIPNKEYNEIIVKFIKDFTEIVFRENKRSIIDYDFDSANNAKVENEWLNELLTFGNELDTFDPNKNMEGQFGLPLLWDLVDTTNVLSKQAFECLKDIFITSDSNEFKTTYIFKCLQNLKKG